MANVVVVGAQWGDEGKGKIVDWLSEQADIVARFQGVFNFHLVVGTMGGWQCGQIFPGRLWLG